MVERRPYGREATERAWSRNAPTVGRQRSGRGRAMPLVTVTELGGNGPPTRVGRTLLDDVTSGSGMGMQILAGATGLGTGSGRNKLTTRSFVELINDLTPGGPRLGADGPAVHP